MSSPLENIPTDAPPRHHPDAGMKLALRLGFLLVVLGMINAMPSLPGLDAWVQEVTGRPDIVIRKFSYEYFYPITFVLMLAIVALSSSFFRASAGHARAVRIAGLAMDVGLILAALAIAAAYLIEIDSVCLIDQIDGTRAQIMAEALQKQKEFAELYGIPGSNTVEDPPCQTTLGVWIFPLVAVAIAVFLGYNIRVWGLPLVAVAIVIATYALATVAIWYGFGATGMSKYLVTKLGDDNARNLMDGRPNMVDVLTNNAQGLMGRFLAIMLNTVFPYIILGALFGVSAGGKALIKVAFLWTRRLRGGPAHAAIVSSAMFGTISGGPVVNVLSTGVLTIPMMLKRGFNRTFAGGIEAAASSGGQIMPPVMGVAAFILASMTMVPYREVITAAVLPAIAYFGALFLTVSFQARKLGLEPVGREVTPEMRLTRDDRLHLLMIFAPIALILFLLVTSKDAIGCGPTARFFGVSTLGPDGACVIGDMPWLFELVRNSAGDAGSAGWWATALLIGLFFLDRDIRRSPGRILGALSDAGVMISRLFLMFLAVSVIDFSLNFTGLSTYIALDVVKLIDGLGAVLGQGGLFLFVGLVATMALSILLGMGMPTAPAYINVALLIGPMLASLGIANFTANMFIFYFAVASAITPPVAIAAFAAAEISGADPMRTGFAAVRAGIVMFVIPFIFAFYPELLLIEAAQINPLSEGGRYLAGYDGTVHWPAMVFLGLRVGLSLYLLASVLARFDARRLSRSDVALRLALAVLVLAKPLAVSLPALAATAVLVGWHWRGALTAPPAPDGGTAG